MWGKKGKSKRRKWKGPADEGPTSTSLVWDLRPGESFKATMPEKKKIKKEADDRYMRDGATIVIQDLGGEEILVAYKPLI